VEGRGGGRGSASCAASIAYPEGELLVGGASRQAVTSQREAQQLGLTVPKPPLPERDRPMPPRPRPEAPPPLLPLPPPPPPGEWHPPLTPPTTLALPMLLMLLLRTAAERAAGVTGFALGSSADSSGSSDASFRWLRKLRYEVLWGPMDARPSHSKMQNAK
jgi:hypothetical protein